MKTEVNKVIYIMEVGAQLMDRIRREFYDDYRASNFTLAEYIRTTQSAAM